MKYLFLYTELADYTIKCIESHIEFNSSDVIYLVAYPVNAEAPFKFNTKNNVHIYNQEDYMVEDLWELVEKIVPDVIFCSGWVNKKYLKVVNVARHKYPCLLIVDNPWRGSLKQRLLAPYAKYKFRKMFVGAWVPGQSQKLFMAKLGFDNEVIFTGFYSTNNKIYNQQYIKSKEKKAANFPKIVVCAARYIPQKGLEYLWDAFNEINDPEWELWMFGIGINFENRTRGPKIKHLGFIQPTDLVNKMGEMGVFVLPSLFEPWGMVVHEFAAAGFPLLLSRTVFSGELFLEEGKNGYYFEAGNTKSIKSALLKMMKKPNAELIEMSKKSIELAQKNDSVVWSNTLKKICSKFVK